MTKLEAAKSIIAVIAKYDNRHYQYDELRHAYEIINFLEEIKLLKPTHKKTIIRRDLELIPYEDTITVEGWGEDE